MVCRSMFAALTLLLTLAASALSQQASKISCDTGIWSLQTDEQIAAYGISEKVAIFSAALTEARKHDRVSRTVKLHVADCPVYGYAIRAIKQHSGMNAGIMMNIPPAYGIYATVALIRNKADGDLVHEARKQTCMIMTNVADNSGRPEDFELPASTKRNIQTCELQLAVNFDDADYATWLSKTLGVTMPEKQAALNLSIGALESVVRAIDLINGLPASHPMRGVVKDLEELRRSFQEFPTLQQDR